MVTYVHGPRTCSTLHERLVKRLRHGGCMHVANRGAGPAARTSPGRDPRRNRSSTRGGRTCPPTDLCPCNACKRGRGTRAERNWGTPRSRARHGDVHVRALETRCLFGRDHCGARRCMHARLSFSKRKKWQTQPCVEAIFCSNQAAAGMWTCLLAGVTCALCGRASV